MLATAGELYCLPPARKSDRRSVDALVTEKRSRGAGVSTEITPSRVPRDAIVGGPHDLAQSGAHFAGVGAIRPSEELLSSGIMWRVKVRDLIRRLEAAGWQLKTTRGSHRQYRHPVKGMVVTVPGHAGKDVPVGTLKAILRSAALEDKETNG